MDHLDPTPLRIQARDTDNGVLLLVDDRPFRIEYPEGLWGETPPSIRQTLVESLAFGNTHFLPLMLGKSKIDYDFGLPIFESHLFKNQLYDLPSCEKADGAEPLSYLKRFFNLDLTFKNTPGALPDFSQIPRFTSEPPTAILPFTFGKESLATFALCQELGIRPILMYSQEPAHPHEEEYKVKQLKNFSQEFNVPAYFIQNEPGLFRYGKAFGLKESTEVGWGSQTTLLALMALPLVFRHGARHILFGSEFLNNEFELRNGWKSHNSFDQSSFWTRQQSNMMRLMTRGQCTVQSSLEPIEEINIFHLLHHRYPAIGKYQFSCSGEHPLYNGTQWCHACYKCVRMYLFALCCDIDPASIGFQKNLLEREDLFSHYFGTEFKTGALQDLDFAFYALLKKGIDSPLVKRFKAEKLPHLKPWEWYRSYYSSLQPEENLPPAHRDRLLSIFREEIRAFGDLLP